MTWSRPIIIASSLLNNRFLSDFLNWTLAHRKKWIGMAVTMSSSFLTHQTDTRKWPFRLRAEPWNSGFWISNTFLKFLLCALLGCFVCVRFRSTGKQHFANIFALLFLFFEPAAYENIFYGILSIFKLNLCLAWRKSSKKFCVRELSVQCWQCGDTVKIKSPIATSLKALKLTMKS